MGRSCTLMAVAFTTVRVRVEVLLRVEGVGEVLPVASGDAVGEAALETGMGGTESNALETVPNTLGETAPNTLTLFSGSAKLVSCPLKGCATRATTPRFLDST